MKTSTKYLIGSLLIIAAVVFVVYLFNQFQLTIEQAVGKFMSWLIILLLVFIAGYITGRFGHSKKCKKENE